MSGEETPKKQSVLALSDEERKARIKVRIEEAVAKRKAEEEKLGITEISDEEAEKLKEAKAQKARADRLLNLIKNLYVRMHIVIPITVLVLGMLILAIKELFSGNFDFIVDWYNNKYLQLAIFIITTPEIWSQAIWYVLIIVGAILIQIVIVIVVVKFAILDLIFKKWYLNGDYEGRVVALVHPGGFLHKFYHNQFVKRVYKKFGVPWKPLPTRDEAPAMFYYFENYKDLFFAPIFNPIGPQGLIKFKCPEEGVTISRTLFSYNIDGPEVLVPEDDFHKVMTLAEPEAVSTDVYIEQDNIARDLAKYQNSAGTAVSRAVSLNANEAIMSNRMQGFMLNDPMTDALKELVLNPKFRQALQARRKEKKQEAGE